MSLVCAIIPEDDFEGRVFFLLLVFFHLRFFTIVCMIDIRVLFMVGWTVLGVDFLPHQNFFSC